LCCRRAVSVQAICFSYRLDNDGESQPTDIAQPLSARALIRTSLIFARIADDRYQAASVRGGCRREAFPRKIGRSAITLVSSIDGSGKGSRQRCDPLAGEKVASSRLTV
ncbi:hypothetical protein U1839_22345, partial [Sphingomonas sp. RT2P30]|uniref:hypothetical protein n=1 Tax=Parasphingomonas halimpatiens TaxID=3096162 RepID=UPI002FCC320F